MVIGQGFCGGRRPHEQGGIEAGPSEVAQPFCQLWQEWVCDGARGFYGEQLPPLPFCPGARGGESLVELLLDDPVGAAVLGWPGGSRVTGVDLGGGAPHLYVGDQVGRHVSVELSRPGRCFSCSVAANLVGELSNKL